MNVYIFDVMRSLRFGRTAAKNSVGHLLFTLENVMNKQVFTKNLAMWTTVNYLAGDSIGPLINFFVPGTFSALARTFTRAGLPAFIMLAPFVLGALKAYATTPKPKPASESAQAHLLAPSTDNAHAEVIPTNNAVKQWCIILAITVFSELATVIAGTIIGGTTQESIAVTMTDTVLPRALLAYGISNLLMKRFGPSEAPAASSAAANMV